MNPTANKSFKRTLTLRTLTTVVLIGLSLLAGLWHTWQIVLAADGDLDPSFGSGGKVVTPAAGAFEEAYATAIQTDGRLLVAGSVGRNFVVARYSSAGALDPGFGSGGKTLIDFSSFGDPAKSGSAAGAVIVPIGWQDCCWRPGGRIQHL